MAATDLSKTPLHLGLGATAVVEPEFTGGMTWYEAYVARHVADGSKSSVRLAPGQCAINEPGTWHTADIHGEATALVIAHRPASAAARRP